MAVARTPNVDNAGGWLAGRGLGAVHGALLVVQLGYGVAIILNKLALNNGVNSFVFATYRDMVALAVLVPCAYFFEKKRRTPLTFPIVALMLASGLTGIYGGQSLQLLGLSLGSASMASAVPISVPLFTFIIAVSIGQEKIHWCRVDGQAKVLGVLLGVSGALILCTVKGSAILGTTVPTNLTEPILTREYGAPLLDLQIETWQIGGVCLLLGGLCYAIFIVLQVPALTLYPAPISLTAFSYFFGAIMLSVSALLTISDPSDWRIDRRLTVIPFVYAGLVPSALNFTLMAWSCQIAGPLLVAFYGPLQTFTGQVLAYLVLGEAVYFGSLVGAILIAMALYLVTWSMLKTRHWDNLLRVPSPGLGTNHVSLEEPLIR